VTAKMHARTLPLLCVFRECEVGERLPRHKLEVGKRRSLASRGTLTPG